MKQNFFWVLIILSLVFNLVACEKVKKENQETTTLTSNALDLTQTTLAVPSQSMPGFSLPDLAVTDIYLGMQGVPSNWSECVPNYGAFEIRAVIRNLGGASAYNIDVVELASGINLTIGELGAGQSMELFFPISSSSASYNVVVDPQNAISESSEGNNSFSYIAITPTPPRLCTTP